MRKIFTCQTAYFHVLPSGQLNQQQY